MMIGVIFAQFVQLLLENLVELSEIPGIKPKMFLNLSLCFKISDFLCLCVFLHAGSISAIKMGFNALDFKIFRGPQTYDLFNV